MAARQRIGVLALVAIGALLSGCGPLACVGPFKYVQINPWGQRCYFMWKGDVASSLVSKAPSSILLRRVPLREAATWVEFPTWVPDQLPAGIEPETFVGWVNPHGDQIQPHGRVVFGFDHPTRLDVWEMTSENWYAGAAAVSDPKTCAGRRLDVSSARGQACAVETSEGYAALDWDTQDGVHIWISWKQGAQRRTIAELLPMAQSMRHLEPGKRQ